MEFMEETTIIFGNGEETTSNTKAHIGELEAIVCNDNQLTDDLVAIHPIVDAGYDIYLSSKGGVINKPSDGHSFFSILRDGLKWMIDLEELKEIKIKRKPIFLKMKRLNVKTFFFKANLNSILVKIYLRKKINFSFMKTIFFF